MFVETPVRFAFLSSTAFLMAAIAGFTDVLGFISLDKLFTAHITGNIVVAIAELINHTPGVAAKIISLPLFLLIAILITAWIEACGQTKKLLAFLFLMESFLLLGFLGAGLTLIPVSPAASWPYIGTALLPVAAMAIHNTLLRTYMRGFPPCTVMTGNLTQLIVDIVGYSWGFRESYPLEKRSQNLEGIRCIGNVFIAFLLGGAFAAIGYVLTGFWILVLPISVLAYMAAQSAAS